MNHEYNSQLNDLTDEQFKNYFVDTNLYLIHMVHDVIINLYLNKKINRVNFKLSAIYDDFLAFASNLYDNKTISNNIDMICPVAEFNEFLEMVIRGELTNILFNNVFLTLNCNFPTDKVEIGIRECAIPYINRIRANIDKPDQLHLLIDEIYNEYDTCQWKISRNHIEHKDEFRPPKPED